MLLTILIIPILTILPTNLSLSIYPSVITPIGPFSPFRSKSCEFGSPLDESMSEAIGTTQGDDNFYTELQRISLDFTSGGGPPDPHRVKVVAGKMEDSFNKYSSMMSRLSLSSDYQAREYYALTICNLRRSSMTLTDVEESVKWQIESMKAFADNSMPPQPSAKTMEIMQKKNPGGGGMTPPANIDNPFTGSEPCFSDPVVRDELLRLQSDHETMIKMGEGYGKFDPLGQVAFLDRMTVVEERWGIFMTRLDLGEHVGEEFKVQTGGFLEGMGMSVREFFGLMEETKDYMRERAEEGRM